MPFNSSKNGFQNEAIFVKKLNNMRFHNIDFDLQLFLEDLFPNVNGNSLVKCYKNRELQEYDIIIGGSVLSQYKKDLSKYSAKHIFDIGLRNFDANYIKVQIAAGSTIYRFDNRAGISSVVLNLMETDYLTRKNMGAVTVGTIKLVSGGILGEEDAIVVDNAYSPEFIFGVADGQGMFKDNLSEANKKDLKIIESLIGKWIQFLSLTR